MFPEKNRSPTDLLKNDPSGLGTFSILTGSGYDRASKSHVVPQRRDRAPPDVCAFDQTGVVGVLGIYTHGWHADISPGRFHDGRVRNVRGGQLRDDRRQQQVDQQPGPENRDRIAYSFHAGRSFARRSVVFVVNLCNLCSGLNERLHTAILHDKTRGRRRSACTYVSRCVAVGRATEPGGGRPTPDID